MTDNDSQAYYDSPKKDTQGWTPHINLIDLTQISDTVLLTHGSCAPMEILLKHSHTANFELEVDAYRDSFQTCIDVLGDVYLLHMLNYATSLQNKETGEKMYNFIKEIFDNKADIIMTYRDELREEGRKEGIFEVAKTMLCNLRLDVDVITKATGLSTKEVIKLAS